MERYTLKKPESIKSRKRVGRGGGSGLGKTAGRGQKGQLSRTGTNHRPWFEGGQMPLQRRIPKRGFNNIFKTEYQLINVSQLEKRNEKVLDPSIMETTGLIHNSGKLVKILGHGNITKPIKVVADAFSKSAMEKIQKCGGEAVVRNLHEKKEKQDVKVG